MISKTVRQALNKSKGLVSTHSRAMGGGEKKKNMPASETEFDVVIVGK